MARQALLQPNNKHMEITFSLLGIGLPRTGTGYLHMVLRRFGLDVGHECIRPNGCVDWQLALRAKTRKPYGEGSLKQFRRGLVIRTVRDPLTTIPSFIKRVVKVKSATKFIKKNLHLRLFRLNDLEKCIEMMFAFEKCLDSWNPDFTFKIESDAYKLYEFISQYYDNLSSFDRNLVNEAKFYNSDEHGGWNSDLVKMRESLEEAYVRKINFICKKHNYPLFFE